MVDEVISIHSLRMEGDRDQFQQMISDSKFQSTPSAWRETGAFGFTFIQPIHFNPLPPHGGRQLKKAG